MANLLKILILLFLPTFIYAQNSCNEYPLKPLSIISNPSFEILDSEVGCISNNIVPPAPIVQSWYSPTFYTFLGQEPVAYLNACTNFTISDSIIYAKLITHTTNTFIFYPVTPVAIPDGNGIIAINDWTKYFGGNNIFKSYAATCLQNSLQKDSLYQFDFFSGFGNNSKRQFHFEYIDSLGGIHGINITSSWSPSPEKFTLFGLKDCADFTKPLNIRGCPAEGGWSVLGSVTVSGDSGTWVKASIPFRAAADFKAIAIGPSCDTLDIRKGDINQTGFYAYFLDNLQLYQSTVSLPYISISSGSLCNKSVTLQVTPSTAYTNSAKQWFKNGTSLSGETQNNLNINDLNYGEGYYQCRAQNDSVCLISDSFRVQWQVTPSASVFNNNDTILCTGDTLVLNAYTDPSSTYHWQDGSLLPAFTVKQAGIYTVNISNACGNVSVSKKVDYKLCNDSIFVPTAFTPNGDGRNDIFRAKYFYPPEQFSMNIYNRYGENIFSGKNVSEGWDGTYKGKPQPVGSFIWIVKYKTTTGKTISLEGTVTLIK